MLTPTPINLLAPTLHAVVLTLKAVDSAIDNPTYQHLVLKLKTQHVHLPTLATSSGALLFSFPFHRFLFAPIQTKAFLPRCFDSQGLTDRLLLADPYRLIDVIWRRISLAYHTQ